jgi:diguanylate cyclase (GGDEF)-like protein
MTAKVDVAAVQRLLRRFAGWESGRVSLITTSGSPIVGSRSPSAEPARPTVNATTVRRLLEREGATVEYRGLDGRASVGVVKRVPRLDWAVLAEVPAAEAYRQVTRLRNVTALIVVALFAAVGLLAYFLGLLITRPLDRLTRGAAKVAEGDLEVDLPVVSGGELGYVTEVFNDMVARLREGRRELERLSITDHLTGLYNRRYLMDALASEVRRSHRLKHRCALLMADVDHFKAYNDAFGHLAGDEALRRVAAILRQATRDVDCAARYGGEEFVVLMPETEVGGGAAQTAQRIRERLAADSLVGGKLTVSIGLAQFPDDADTPEALLGVADAALYQAKREGRDRVQRASD